MKDRKQPFTDPTVVEVFRNHLAEQSLRFGCHVSVYCFMPDHLHLVLLGTNEEANCKRAIESFKYKTGLWFGKNMPDTRWQKDYWDHVLRNHHDFMNQVSYILRNPIRAGLVENFHDYPYIGSIGVDLNELLMEM